MLRPDALAAFALAQKQLLVDTYDRAWRHGAQNHGGQPPSGPDQVRRAVALALAFKSITAIAASLATLTPSPENTAAAFQALQDGVTSDQAGYAMQQALNDWVDANAWRFDAGESVAWAGEQAGYAETADQTGELLEWNDTGDDHECEDCSVLATMGPLPLSEWPTTPGAGGTECSVGCRCSLTAVPATTDSHEFALTADQQATTDKVLQARSGALDQLMPDMALLS